MSARPADPLILNHAAASRKAALANQDRGRKDAAIDHDNGSAAGRHASDVWHQQCRVRSVNARIDQAEGFALALARSPNHHRLALWHPQGIRPSSSRLLGGTPAFDLTFLLRLGAALGGFCSCCTCCSGALLLGAGRGLAGFGCGKRCRMIPLRACLSGAPVSISSSDFARNAVAHLLGFATQRRSDDDREDREADANDDAVAAAAAQELRPNEARDGHNEANDRQGLDDRSHASASFPGACILTAPRLSRASPMATTPA